MLVAVRLRHAGHTGQVRWCPALGAAQQLRERLHPGLQRTRLRQQVGRVAAQHGGAGRLKPDDREVAAQRAERAPQLPARAVELTGGDPGQSAAHRLAGDADRVTRGLEHLDRGLPHLGGERIGERVHPQHHRRAVSHRMGGEPAAEALRRELRQVAA